MNVDMVQFLSNVLMIVVPIGAPLLILLVLAALLGRWYETHADPPPEAFEDMGEHS